MAIVYVHLKACLCMMSISELVQVSCTKRAEHRVSVTSLEGRTQLFNQIVNALNMKLYCERFCSSPPSVLMYKSTRQEISTTKVG